MLLLTIAVIFLFAAVCANTYMTVRVLRKLDDKAEPKPGEDDEERAAKEEERNFTRGIANILGYDYIGKRDEQ